MQDFHRFYSTKQRAEQPYGFCETSGAFSVPVSVARNARVRRNPVSGAETRCARSAAHSGSEQEREGDRGVAVATERPETAPPPMYKVLLLNDDYTPMAFVEYLLQHFFAMSDEMAHRVMMSVHTSGKGVCGIFSKEIAETKVAQVNNFARQHQHPLMCTMEAA